MTIPPVLNNILAKWQTYAIISGAVVAILGATYLKGHSDGVDQTDNKWKAAIADSKPTVVKVDTIFVVQPVDSGGFQAEIANIKDSYQAHVDKVIRDANSIGNEILTENDSLKQTNRQLEALVRTYAAARLIKLKTPEIGELVLEYFPADSSANIYKHIPPPAKVVTVYTEKLVLEPRSDWETVGYVVLGAGVGAIVAILAHIK